jgi:predicted nucleic-acid-binding protein
MRGLDTNVLVRYLTQDDPKQAAMATREIEGAIDRGEKFLLQPLVLCELVWVLGSAYDFAKPEILNTLERILRTAQFELVEKDILWLALAGYRHGRGDFSDYYLGWANQRDGAKITLSFDRSLKGDPRFQILSIPLSHGSP